MSLPRRQAASSRSTPYPLASRRPADHGGDR
jgi:hypothetical protein